MQLLHFNRTNGPHGVPGGRASGRGDDPSYGQLNHGELRTLVATRMGPAQHDDNSQSRGVATRIGLAQRISALLDDEDGEAGDDVVEATPTLALVDVVASTEYTPSIVPEPWIGVHRQTS